MLALAVIANEKIALGAVVDVRRDGRRVTTLRPARDLFPSADAQGDGPIGRFFDGEATSEVGLRQSAGRDLWVAMQPDTSVLRGAIAEADRRFGAARPEVQAIVIAAITQRWVDQSPPASFRLIVRTGVSWMWLGALILGAGALVALWPRGALRRRRVIVRARTSATRSSPAPARGTAGEADAELEPSR